MGTEDISRSAFDPVKRYASVRMQQGRVTLDDDWNENERIAAEDVRIERLDVIGDVGTSNDGFRISNPGLDPTGHITFDIAAGTMYLGGLRVESFGDTFSTQDDWVNQPLVSPPDTSQDYLAYLEAWQQPVEAVEDDELLEKALGGPDTATRMRTMWRVHLGSVGFGDDCATAWATIAATLGGTLHGAELVPDGTMQIKLDDTGGTKDLCSPPVTAGYLGAENQTIRVQVTKSGKMTWGFDGGSPLYRVALKGDRKTLVLRNLPRDQEHWPLAGQKVEILPWSAVLANGEKVAELTGHMASITKSYDPDTHELVIDVDVPTSFDDWHNRDGAKAELGDWTLPADADRIYYYLRVWDRADDPSTTTEFTIGNAIDVPLGTTGLIASFSHTQFLPGDHWVVAARPDTPDLIVPWAIKKAPRPPTGVRRFYTPLGIVHWKVAGNHTVHDCRPTFTPLVRQRGCCTYTVGNGSTSFGQFSSIEAAVAALPDDGGRICLLSGEHLANVVLDGKRHITIEGCCDQTMVHPRDPAQPVFQIVNSRWIKLLGFAIESVQSPAIQVIAKGRILPSRDLVFSRLDLTCRDTSAIDLQRGIRVRIEDNRVTTSILLATLEDPFIGRAPAVFVAGDDILVERNKITAPLETRYTLSPYGGLQIGGGSRRVEVRRNWIEGGHGHAITLGSYHFVKIGGIKKLIDSYDDDSDWIYIPAGWGWHINDQGCLEIDWDPPPPGGDGGGLIPVPSGTLEHIRILDNDLRGMGHSGVAVVRYFFASALGTIIVDDLEITGNRITDCLRVATVEIPAAYRDVAGYGAIALADGQRTVIRDNVIEHNGISHTDPVCGVFVLAAEGLDVIGNRITETPPRDEATSVTKAGWRGGVVVVSVDVPEEPDDAPAARVLDNVIVHENGRALVLLGFGTMMIAHNQLVSRGLASANIGFEGLLETVSAVGMYPAMTYWSARKAMKTGEVVEEMPLIEEVKGNDAVYDYDKTPGKYLDVRGIDVTTGPILGAGMFGALDFLGGAIALVQQHRVRRLLQDYDVTEGVPTTWMTGYQPVMMTNYAEGVTININPAVADALRRQRTVDVMFHGNQAALDLVERGGIAISAISVEGRGDVAVSDNQVQANLYRGFLYTTVWASGQTSGLTGNAIFDTLAHVNLSGFAEASIAASATGNRSSHCIQVDAPDELNGGNLVVGGFDCKAKLEKHITYPIVHYLAKH